MLKAIIRNLAGIMVAATVAVTAWLPFGTPISRVSHPVGAAVAAVIVFSGILAAAWREPGPQK